MKRYHMRQELTKYRLVPKLTVVAQPGTATSHGSAPATATAAAA